MDAYAFAYWLKGYHPSFSPPSAEQWHVIASYLAEAAALPDIAPYLPGPGEVPGEPG